MSIKAKLQEAKKRLAAKFSAPACGLGAVNASCSISGVCTPKDGATKTKFENLQKAINRAATALNLSLSIIPVDGIVGVKTLASLIKISNKLSDSTWLWTTFALETVEGSYPTTQFVVDNVDKITSSLLAIVPPVSQPTSQSQPARPAPLPGTQQASTQPATSQQQQTTPAPGTFSVPWPANQTLQPIIVSQAKSSNWLIGLGVAAGVVLIGALLVSTRKSPAGKSIKTSASSISPAIHRTGPRPFSRAGQR